MNFKIPTIVFFVTFVATLVLIVVLSKVYDKDPDLKTLAGAKSLPPFPDVAPLVAPPITEASTSLCLHLVGDQTGGYVPSPLDALQPCTSTTDCANCTTSPVPMDLDCVAPSTEVATQQSAIGNPSAKYCLPAPQTCLASDTPLLSCTHDADCASCSDEIGSGAGLQCQLVTDPKKISLLDKQGADLTDEDLRTMSDADVLEVPTGQWCLPKTGTCDNENGLLHWTTAGWKCTCRYPAVHGGERCDVFKACNNPLTTDWSAGNQQLLINDTETPPRVWSMDSGVNPMLCHVQGSTEWDKPCDTGTVPNVVCQCDGLMLGSHMGFRNEPHDPLTCAPDSCSVNALGGHASEPLTMLDWSPNNPSVGLNECVCSGANSRIWEVDTRDPAVVEEDDPVLAETLRMQQGYLYTGRCQDTTIATNGAVVVLAADPEHVNSVACSLESNKHAETTSLVPGYAVDEAGTAMVSVCSADPCRAHYSDINFRPPEDLQSHGHYNADVGACECVSPAKSVSTDAQDITVNPVGGVCANACAGMESADPNDWPCKQDPNRPCPLKPECLTGDNGEAVCVCAEGCGNSNGNMCTEQFENFESCHGYAGAPNVCKSDDNGNPSRCLCHQGRDRSSILASCENTDEWYSMCTTSLSADVACHVGEDRNASLCGGSTNFRCGGTPGCNREFV